MQKIKTLKQFLISIFLVCVLTACQETPKEQAVINKGNNMLESIILEANPEEKAYVAPESWTEVHKKGEHLVININASLIFSDASKFPIMNVSPKEISQNDADSFINTLFGNEPTYDPIIRDIVTKEKQLESIQSLISFMNDVKRENPTLYEDLGGERATQDEVEKMQSQLSSLPDMVDPILSDREFKNEYIDIFGEKMYDGVPGLGIINIITNYERNSPPLIRIIKNESNKINEYNYINYKSRDDIPTEIYDENLANAKGLSTTKEQAIQLASDMLDKLNFKDMSLNTIVVSPRQGDFSSFSMKPLTEKESSVYSLFFTKKIGDIPWTYVNTRYSKNAFLYGINIDAPEENQYREEWDDEVIVITVDDSGVTSLKYTSPTKVNGVFSENSELLDFETIKSKFISQMEHVCQPIPDSGIIKTEFDIDMIKLGYARVAKQDNLNEYLLVPAWDFFGSVRIYYAKEIIDSGFDENNSYEEKNFGQSFLTINAIDGSIINRALGY